MEEENRKEYVLPVQEFILLIMNCKKYRKKALFQKKTWLLKIPSYLKYYHVIGEEDLEKEYQFDEDNRILYVKTPDDYNSLPKKVIASYHAICQTVDFHYLFKTDDDQILVKFNFLDTIAKLIKYKQPQCHYGGYIIDVKQPYLSQYHRIHPELPKQLPLYPTTYCSGRFYFLSKKAISYLMTKRENIANEYLEDYAIGFHLHSIYKTHALHIATNNFFTDIEQSDFEQWIKEKKI